MISLIPIIAGFGFKLLEEKDFKELPWDVVFMVGGGVSLGVSQMAGIDTMIQESVRHLDHISVGILLGIGLFVMVVSTFMSNTATAGLLIPLIVVIGKQHRWHRSAPYLLRLPVLLQ